MVIPILHQGTRIAMITLELVRCNNESTGRKAADDMSKSIAQIILANPEIFSADSECSDSELDDVLAEFDDPWDDL
ncbi:hypothetical protein EB796_008503 [Bugula neritina]|uniref:Uncharacterized protein n=1 Tax=Bugula neritina TaxID=10212 RepID=A0A7J7K6G9_BUGNE|nr:hypothetical protein EB796_008503 [Bugula neritina]